VFFALLVVTSVQMELNYLGEIEASGKSTRQKQVSGNNTGKPTGCSESLLTEVALSGNNTDKHTGCSVSLIEK
jgi:hypothetical protein